MVIGAFAIGAHAGLRLRARRVPARGRAPRARHRAGARIRPARQRHHGQRLRLRPRDPHGLRRLRLRRGNRADDLDRGQPRRAAPAPAVPGRQGPLGQAQRAQQRRDLRQHRPDHPQGRRVVRQHRHREEQGHQGVRARPATCNNTGLVEVPDRHAARRDHLRDRRRHPGRQELTRPRSSAARRAAASPRSTSTSPWTTRSLQELGAIMGSGGLIVMDEDTCMVDIARFFLEFTRTRAAASARPAAWARSACSRSSSASRTARARRATSSASIALGETIRQTALCGLGQTAANPVLSTIRHFRHEYEAHIKDHYCEAGVCSSMFMARCSNACPASVNIPGFVSLVGEERYDEALKLHRERNPLASICARVCFHPCESKCMRASLDGALAIRHVKRFMVEQEKDAQLPEIQENAENAARKVAVVGSGPAGLSAAYFLARLGYKPIVFEAESKAGGMLVQAIPAYRLPREELEREVRMIEAMGVDVRVRQGARPRLHPAEPQGRGLRGRVRRRRRPAGHEASACPARTGRACTTACPSSSEYNVHGTARWARTSPSSAAATRPSTPPAPPCASAPSRSRSSTAARARRCRRGARRSTPPTLRASRS